MSVESDKNLSISTSTSKDSGATIAVKVYDNLISELRCPGCAYPMRSPIKLCESGHAICHSCLRMLEKCPLCLKSFTEIRSLTLEALTAKAQFKCSNASFGCTVRLQLKLLDKHEERCAYQLGHCFMGKVWDNCKWQGREIDWVDHCEVDHREKVFFGAEVTRTWELKRNNPKSICGYYLFRVFNETFDFYQIFDNLRSKVYWTLVCASNNPNDAKRYSYELELFSPSDDTKLAVQRNPCNSEINAGILQKSAVFGLGELMGFMDNNRILHYRIKILENDLTKRMSTISNRGDARSRFFETDYSQTNIEGSNIIRIPPDNIITRQTNKSTSINGETINTPEIDATSRSSISRDSLNSAPNSKESSPANVPLCDEPNIADEPTKFGSRKSISVTTSNQSEPCSPNRTELRPMISNGHVNDSIDQTIIENNDLKKIFIRSYSIDVKNIDDFLTDEAAKSANSIPKPPRLSLDVEKQNVHEVKALLSENIGNEKSPQ
ncbi:hypothetical protein HA402_002067 [Bradysia odoriphaga]|nr:hypothetical protein HA402_002067 [Bradysia odoriphaga]